MADDAFFHNAVMDWQPLIICKQSITQANSYKYHWVHVDDTVSRKTLYDIHSIKAESADLFIETKDVW